MSAIDGYAHRCLGVLTCPARYPLVYYTARFQMVPIYRLDEDVEAQERSFQGKRGDILIGGGHGECAVLRISIPKAFYFYTHADWERFPGAEAWTPTGLATAYWSMTNAYVFGAGYHEVGWTPAQRIEQWLTEHVLRFLVLRYPSEYACIVGTEALTEDGSIGRLPAIEEGRRR